MSIADELHKLDELRLRGVLSDAEFQRAKQRLIDGVAPAGQGMGTSQAPGIHAINAFRRSRSDKWIGGVCGGLARSTGVDSWAWRLMLSLLFLCGGVGGLLYILLWIFVPAE